MHRFSVGIHSTPGPRRRLRAAATLLALACSACAGAPPRPHPEFEIAMAELGPDAAQRTVISRNNRVSAKSVAGGAHFDLLGVFLNPTVTRDPQRQVLALGLKLENQARYDTAAGAPNALGTPLRVSFLLDGASRLLLPVHDGTSGWETGGSGSIVSETGLVSLSVEQYAQILAARSLAVQIQGSKRSVVYAPDELEDEFVGNLRRFFEQHIRE